MKCPISSIRYTGNANIKTHYRPGQRKRNEVRNTKEKRLQHIFDQSLDLAKNSGSLPTDYTKVVLMLQPNTIHRRQRRKKTRNTKQSYTFTNNNNKQLRSAIPRGNPCLQRDLDHNLFLASVLDKRHLFYNCKRNITQKRSK